MPPPPTKKKQSSPVIFSTIVLPKFFLTLVIVSLGDTFLSYVNFFYILYKNINYIKIILKPEVTGLTNQNKELVMNIFHTDMSLYTHTRRTFCSSRSFRLFSTDSMSSVTFSISSWSWFNSAAFASLAAATLATDRQT